MRGFHAQFTRWTPAPTSSPELRSLLINSLRDNSQQREACAYFTHWCGSLDQAQHDKLEMICRKLRLKPGDRLLDIGCGWGGLICYAAQKYGVTAHGITMSEKQLDLARETIERLGLSDRVTVELKDYAELDGELRQDRLDRHV